MRALHAHGVSPDDVVLADLPDPPPPGPQEVALDLIAMTINPADLLTLEGRYGVRPPPPFIPGAESVARVAAVGAAATGLAPGDIVIPFGGQNWAEKMTTRAAAVVKLPAGVDLLQAAMLKANPATAYAMLADIVDLAPGDWVAQNAANSAVGTNVVKIARELGLKTLNIVRSEAAAAPLRALGADRVLVGDEAPGPDAPRARLAFDAIGGAATQRLADLCADGATIVNYGLLGGQPCQLGAHDLVFRDVRLQGFWLAKWFPAAGPEKIAARYARLVEWLAAGRIGAPVEATYPLEEFAQALAHAARPGRSGKILFTTPLYEELTK